MSELLPYGAFDAGLQPNPFQTRPPACYRVGAEPVVHGGDLWYHWTVAVGHDRWL
jgi:hypothetical protein